MHANNHFSRRRPTGWAERRRLFRRLFERERPQTAKENTTKKAEESTKA